MMKRHIIFITLVLLVAGLDAPAQDSAEKPTSHTADEAVTNESSADNELDNLAKKIEQPGRLPGWCARLRRHVPFP